MAGLNTGGIGGTIRPGIEDTFSGTYIRIYNSDGSKHLYDIDNDDTTVTSYKISCNSDKKDITIEENREESTRIVTSSALRDISSIEDNSYTETITETITESTNIIFSKSDFPEGIYSSQDTYGQDQAYLDGSFNWRPTSTNGLLTTKSVNAIKGNILIYKIDVNNDYNRGGRFYHEGNYSVKVEICSGSSVLVTFTEDRRVEYDEAFNLSKYLYEFRYRVKNTSNIYAKITITHTLGRWSNSTLSNFYSRHIRYNINRRKSRNLNNKLRKSC